MKRVTAKSAHAIPARAPIQLTVGETVRTGDRDTDWPEFVFVTTQDGGSGWVPARHLAQSTGTVITPYDTTELPTEVGEVLEVLREDLVSGWLWCRSSSGREGWVPVRTVEGRCEAAPCAPGVNPTRPDADDQV